MTLQRSSRRKADYQTEPRLPKKRPRKPNPRFQKDSSSVPSSGKARKIARILRDAPSSDEHPEDEESTSKKATKTKSRAQPTSDCQEEATGSTYFESYRGTVRTSNLTLASLNILPAASLEKARQELVDPLEDEQQTQLEHLKAQFAELSFILAAGQSLLLYGFGSKKILMDDFASHQASFSPVVVVNGFNPTLSLRAVLAQITGEVLQLKSSHPKRTLLDYVDAIRDGIRRDGLSVVVHNIDGPALRSSEAQQALAALSAVDGVTLAASVDHLNAPLLWDGATYSQFSWAWIKADTFVPYNVETVFCSKPLLRGGDERQVEGAIALLKSLSERARKVFRELAKRQTGGAALRDDVSEADDNHQQVRTTFNELFEASKGQFLASDPASLQVILTELQTHHLLECRRGANAASQLWIPLQLSQLRAIIKAVDLAIS